MADTDAVRRRDPGVQHTTGADRAAMGSTCNCPPMTPQVLVDGHGYVTVGRRLDPADLAA